MIRFAFPLAALAAAGCTAASAQTKPSPAPAPPPVVAAGTCGAAKLGSLIGKKRSPEVAAEALRLSGASVVRWLTPGMIVTMEYRPDRLNLHLGTDGKIGSARCG